MKRQSVTDIYRIKCGHTDVQLTSVTYFDQALLKVIEGQESDSDISVAFAQLKGGSYE